MSQPADRAQRGEESFGRVSRLTRTVEGRAGPRPAEHIALLSFSLFFFNKTTYGNL